MVEPIKDMFPESGKSKKQNWQGMKEEKDLIATQNDL